MVCDLCGVSPTEEEIQSGKGNLFPIGYISATGEFKSKYLCARCINAVLAKFGKPAQPKPQPIQPQPVQHPFQSPLEQAINTVNQPPQQQPQPQPQLKLQPKPQQPQPEQPQPKPEPQSKPSSGYQLKKGDADVDSV